MTQKITDARLIELIEAWGADANAYPERDREAAKALLAAAPERFAAELKVARDMDGLLGGVSDVMPSTAFTAALVDSAPRAPAARRSWFAAIPRWPAVGALASLAIGLAIGLGTAQTAPAGSSEEAVDTLIYAALGFETTYTLEAAQ
jgi:hypothetical protein|tara:strand:+ start:194913 stop:195353 length:441 start_codon:yes stop_codon:yes gene_type:complete